MMSKKLYIYKARSATLVFLLILLFLDHIYVYVTQGIVISRSGYIMAIALVVYFFLEFYFKRIKKTD